MPKTPLRRAGRRSFVTMVPSVRKGRHHECPMPSAPRFAATGRPFGRTGVFHVKHRVRANRQETPMQQDCYFGTYARFETSSKKEGSALVGADNLVGDRFDIEFLTEDGVTTAWMRNRFGALAGFFDENLSRRLAIMKARGWKLQALLSFVAYTRTGPLLGRGCGCGLRPEERGGLRSLPLVGGQAPRRRSAPRGGLGIAGG